MFAIDPVPWARSQMAFTLASHTILVPLGVSWAFRWPAPFDAGRLGQEDAGRLGQEDAGRLGQEDMVEYLRGRAIVTAVPSLGLLYVLDQRGVVEADEVRVPATST